MTLTEDSRCSDGICEDQVLPSICSLSNEGLMNNISNRSILN